ncbi:MAG TPA: Clp protease ClpP [Candidatus Omnitrophica bacterium]|nr:Clp protease ClpP [Candidatus Omnitrophota bacterium]
MRNMHIAGLLFNRPLMISEAKLGVILHILGPRLNLDLSGLPKSEAVVVSDSERARAGYQVMQNNTAVIGVYGPLMHRCLASEFPSGGPTTYAEIWKAFDMAMADDAVQSVVMDFDTPGGDVSGCFDFADHIYQSRGIKPITAVVNEMAYSAGYLLASACSRIVVPRTGAVGSVGVIACHADFSRAEEAAGITVTHVFAGARKADYSPHAPLGSEALSLLQQSVDETREMFVETVARNRGMTVQAVRDTEAGMFEGKKAVQIGLADEVAPAAKAIAAAGKSKKRSMLHASTPQKESTMDISQLRMEHPELVAQIEAEARAGMIAQADAASAQAAAVTAEQTRMVGLVAATMGEAVGAKLGAIAAKGLSAEDVTTLGITLSAESAGSTFDEESRAAILAGLQAAAPTGVKAAKLETGAAAERASVVSAIAAGGSRK